MTASTKQRNIRVTETTHRTLSDLAAQSGESMTAIVEHAVDRYRREQVLLQANAAWSELMLDPEFRAEMAAEDALWDTTVGDGLEDELW